MDTIAQRIRAVRGQMTQADFAGELDLNPNTLRNYETGRVLPNHEVLQSICRKFSVTPKWLLLGLGPMHAEGVRYGQADGPAFRQVPVVGLAACALKGWYNVREVALGVSLHVDNGGPDSFAVIAMGLSMQPEGIRPGYVVFCDPDVPLKIDEPVYIEKQDGTSSIKVYTGQDEKWLHLRGWLDPNQEGAQKPYSEKLALDMVRRLSSVVLIKRR